MQKTSGSGKEYATEKGGWDGKNVLLYAQTAGEAQRALEDGYEPIECAFGREGSVVGPLEMDHHGAFSHLPGVAIRAHGEHWGARRDDPRFVVVGSCDADATAAIVGLAGLLRLDTAQVDLINEVDLRGPELGSLLKYGDAGVRLLTFNRMTRGLPRCQGSFERAVEVFLDVFGNELPETEREETLRLEMERRAKALQGFECEATSQVAFASNSVWAFDVWYDHAPCVVVYSEQAQAVSIGCKNLTEADRLFGPGGLKSVFLVLDKETGKPGWGGREAVGGSPRNLTMSLGDARQAVEIIRRLVRP